MPPTLSCFFYAEIDSVTPSCFVILADQITQQCTRDPTTLSSFIARSASDVGVKQQKSISTSEQQQADQLNEAIAPKGLPEILKSELNSMSGRATTDVEVHYDAGAPLNANAPDHRQGNDLKLTPGQDRHLPHEAWHAVQHKQGRVAATSSINSQPLNDNAMLEREADQMGEKAQS